MYDPNKPNIAICFSGRITGYENNIEGLSKFNNTLNQQYNVYYFCSLNNEKNEYHIDFEKFIDQLCVKSFFNYEQFKVDTDLSHYKDRLSMCSMFYNQKKCLDMIIESAIQFDIVFKWRTEICFTCELKIVENINDNTLYVPNCDDHGGLNDQAAYGNFETMKLYFELYNHLGEYTTVMCHPETLVKHHCIFKKINIERFQFAYYLKR